MSVDPTALAGRIEQALLDAGIVDKDGDAWWSRTGPVRPEEAATVGRIVVELCTLLGVEPGEVTREVRALQDPAPTPTPAPAAVATDRAALAAAVERGLRDAGIVDEEGDVLRADETGCPVAGVAAAVVDALVAPAAPTITVGQTIETAAQLTACLPGTAVRTQAGLLAERLDTGRWRLAGVAGDYATDGLSLPARVVDLGGGE